MEKGGCIGMEESTRRIYTKDIAIKTLYALDEGTLTYNEAEVICNLLESGDCLSAVQYLHKLESEH